MKTQLTVDITDKNSTAKIELRDANGKIYVGINDVLTRIKQMHSGVQIKVKNCMYDKTQYDKYKRYYIHIDKYNNVQLIYVNLRANVCTVIADLRYDKKDFVRKLCRIGYVLHTLNGVDGRKAYTINVYAPQALRVKDDGVINVEKTDPVYVQYKNANGEVIDQRWLDLTDALNYVIYKTDKKQQCVIQTPKGTIVFAK